MTTKQRREDPRADILEAAQRVVARQGSTGLSIDAVAKEAGLSKGGVLHHFPSKDALLSGFIEFFAQRASTVVRSRMEQFPQGEKARAIRAMLAMAFPHLAADDDEPETHAHLLRSHRDFMHGIMTTGLLNRELVRPLRALRQQFCCQILEDEHIGKAELLLWLALDGLWMWKMVGLVDEGDSLWNTISAALVARAKELGRPDSERSAFHSEEGSRPSI